MVITETTTRQCCQPQDLITIVSSPAVGIIPVSKPQRAQKQCRYCGMRYILHWYIDAAGDRDYDWIPDI